MSVDKAITAPRPDPSASDAGQVRALLREATFATLASLDPAAAGGSTGAPYASLVEVATTVDGLPVLLLSRLARHTRNVLADARVSLLMDRRDRGSAALAEPRASIAGRLRLDASAATRSRFLRRHPQAAAYADFGDFQFWSLHIESAHLIAGFGRIREVAGTEVRGVTGTEAAFAALTAYLTLNEAELIAMFEEEARAGDKGADWECLAGLDAEGADIVRGGSLRRLLVSADTKDPATYREAIREVLGLTTRR